MTDGLPGGPRWRQEVDRWELIEPGGEVVGAVTFEFQASESGRRFESALRARGWPVPPPRLVWRRTADGWELIEPGADENEVTVTLEFLAHPASRAAFEQEARERGWPPLPADAPPPASAAEGSWEPFRVEEVVLALDGGPAGMREAVAQRDARWLRRDAREAGVLGLMLAIMTSRRWQS